jgi:hypothetical protein
VLGILLAEAWRLLRPATSMFSRSGGVLALPPILWPPGVGSGVDGVARPLVDDGTATRAMQLRHAAPATPLEAK